MVRLCLVENCLTNQKKYHDRSSFTYLEKRSVFKFPSKRRPDLCKEWVNFVGGNCFPLTDSKGICSAHFDKKFLNVGKRTTLKWELNPIPSVNHDLIKDFDELNSSMCPPGYQFMLKDDLAIFYRIGENDKFNIPEITECITVDKSLHARLFLRSSPIPLPTWFRTNGFCRVTRKSILENFPAYIKNYTEMNEKDSSIMAELQQLMFNKPIKGPKYSSNLLRFSLLLRYSSVCSYKLLLEHFPLPSISYLRKLCQGGVDPLKGAKLLLEKEKIDENVIMMLDEIYLQKEEQYSGGRLIGSNELGELYKGVMTFMIVGLKKSKPWVVKAIPETKIEGKWLANHIDETICSIHQAGFRVRGVVADDHSTNVLAFNTLLKKYPSQVHNSISHPSKKELPIYLFFDTVHLVKNVRNNLLNCKKFIFPEFLFEEFPNTIEFPGGAISWKLLHDVHDKDAQIQANMKKAYKLSHKVLHPGDNKQSVPLALSIFDPTTSSAIKSYFPLKNDAAGFLNLFYTWWTISNSKTLYNSNNMLGNAATLGDKKPLFLRSFAEWLEKWRALQYPSSEKYAMSKQTFSAFITTLRCTASLIEDLLNDGFSYVLTARFQSDPLELRYSKYRQMNGGRFLVGLREVETSERVLSVTSLLKEDIYVWKEDVNPDNDFATEITLFEKTLEMMQSDIESCMLGNDGIEVAAVIAGFVAKKTIDRRNCEECKNLLISSDNVAAEYSYLSILSRGGLTIPSIDLCHYISKSFAILDTINPVIRQTILPDRSAAKLAMKFNTYPTSFLCCNHQSDLDTVNLTVMNIYLNNERKRLTNEVRKDNVKKFKTRQRVSSQVGS